MPVVVVVAVVLANVVSEPYVTKRTPYLAVTLSTI